MTLRIRFSIEQDIQPLLLTKVLWYKWKGGVFSPPRLEVRNGKELLTYPVDTIVAVEELR